MTIYVNGEPAEIETQLTVRQLLETLGYEQSYVAVALNNDCISRAAFGETIVRPGDKLEILAPMAGG